VFNDHIIDSLQMHDQVL
jgi:hypothetical protein